MTFILPYAALSCSSIGLDDVLSAEFISSYTTQDEGCALLAGSFILSLFLFFRKYMRTPIEANITPNTVPPIKLKMQAITEKEIQ